MKDPFELIITPFVGSDKSSSSIALALPLLDEEWLSLAAVTVLMSDDIVRVGVEKDETGVGEIFNSCESPR